MRNTIVCPTFTGEFVGAVTVLAIVMAGDTAVCGTDDVLGGTGIPLVVLGVASATFVPVPEATAVNLVVITVEPPTASGPTFVHVKIPGERLVELADGACEMIERRFVLNVSVT